ncbi:MAG: DUF4271 domain-containing protein [Flavobacteriaceae bacterium]|nr:DUF4271 domain-containing protein [Bacteroidia bacterium]MBT8287654.1 DUF4271 domain-containing protein [Bacteroidia bacterium]NNF73989.1 DUF4271 domain-containing protein [Flavobacteriaceae bacterium]NNK72855.1 DUF4271 domain-containing protein [Flavobacteriaceae bacterium]
MLREVTTNEWFTIIFLISLGILAFTKYVHTNRFHDFIALLVNSKYLKIYARDQKFIDQFDALLFGNLILSGSVFIFISYQSVLKPVEFDLVFFLKILTVLGIVLLIKVLIERLIGSVFELDALIDEYVFQKTSYKNYTGLFLLPVNVIFLYAVTLTEMWLYIVLGLIFLINFMGFVTTFKSNQKLILSNFFYFILYLCALEIGPYVIMFKVLDI